MKKFDFSRFSEVDRISWRIDELRSGLSGANPARLAQNAGASWEPLNETTGKFQLSLWMRPIFITYPDWIVRKYPTEEAASQLEQALLLYYFNIADGFPLSGNWISFSDLPDGRFYNQAFHGYTGRELSRAFQDDHTAFERAAQSLGGERIALGDASFVFQALPYAPMCVVFWQGDEDFPSSAQVLFDASASHYLTTDAYAILGSTITRRLIVARHTSK